MIEGIVAAVVLAAPGQDIIDADVSGGRTWRVAIEGDRASVAFLPTVRDGTTREVVLITTAWIAVTPGADAALHQSFFVHILDCEARTETRTGFGATEPPPRRWTPQDGPPMPRPAVVPEPIRADTAMAVMAAATCDGGPADLPEIEGDWSTVAATLRRRVESSVAASGRD